MYLMHHGIKEQKWGVRRYQNKDGSLTEAGKKHYGTGETEESDKTDEQDEKKTSSKSSSTKSSSGSKKVYLQDTLESFAMKRLKPGGGSKGKSSKSKDPVDEEKTNSMIDKKKESLEKKIDKTDDKEKVEEYKTMLKELDSIDSSSMGYKKAQAKVKEIMDKL